MTPARFPRSLPLLALWALGGLHLATAAGGEDIRAFAPDGTQPTHEWTAAAWMMTPMEAGEDTVDDDDETDDESEDDGIDENDPEGDDPEVDEEEDDADDEDADEDSDDDDEEAEDEEDADDEEGDDEDADEEDADDDEILPLTIETLTSIDWKKGDKLPKSVMKYDGKRVKISGYMATGTELDASEFELVPQNCECGRSKVNHFVKVIIEDGGAEFDPARVQFTGRLEIGEVEEDGFVTSLYRLTIETFDPEEPDDDTALRAPGAWAQPALSFSEFPSE